MSQDVLDRRDLCGPGLERNLQGCVNSVAELLQLPLADIISQFKFSSKINKHSLIGVI